MRLRLAAAAVACSLAASAQADTAYVFLTDGQSVPAGWEAAVNAAYGTTSTFRYIRPGDTGVTINGAAVKYTSTDNNVAKFNVLGNLTLDGGERVIAYGSNLLALNVANNASIVSGSAITARAFGPFAGAGGGTGGAGAKYQGPATIDTNGTSSIRGGYAVPITTNPQTNTSYPNSAGTYFATKQSTDGANGFDGTAARLGTDTRGLRITGGASGTGGVRSTGGGGGIVGSSD